MSRHGGWRELFRQRLDLLAAAGGVVVALALLPLQLLASQVYLRTLPVVLGIASGLYLYTARTDQPEGTRPHLPRWAAQLLPSLVLFGVAAMILLAVFQGRTLLYYYVSVWTGLLVLVQICFVDDSEFHTGALLTQVILFALIYRLTAVYTSPGYIGIDVWTHIPNWAAAIRDTGSLEAIANEKYYASPLFHLLVVVGSLLLDVSLRQGTILTIGIAMPFVALFVYTTARLFVDARWATFAAAVFSMSGHVVEWGIHLIPTSLGLAFFMAIVYLMIRILYFDSEPRAFALVIPFSIAIILTHQISTFIMLVFVGSALLAKLLFAAGVFEPRMPDGPLGGRKETANLAGLLAFDLGLITFMWSMTPYQGSNFLETMFRWFGSTLQSSAGFLNLAGPSGSGASQPTTAPPTLLEKLPLYLDAAALLLMLFVGILGCLYILRRKNSAHATVTLVITVAVILVFVFGFPLFGIRTFVPGRWMAFLVALLAVVGAIGIRFLAARAPAHVAVAVIVLFAVAFPPIALTTGEATQDAPVIDGVQVRYDYTERELAAAETVTDISPSGSAIYTDHPYSTVLDRTHEYDSRVAHINGSDLSNRRVLYRDYQGTGAAYFELGGEYPSQRAVDRRGACADRSVLYTNGGARLCVGDQGG